jgi:hypothetical protein
MEHYLRLRLTRLRSDAVHHAPLPLDRWDEAVLAVKDSRRTGAVKVLLEPAR